MGPRPTWIFEKPVSCSTQLAAANLHLLPTTVCKLHQLRMAPAVTHGSSISSTLQVTQAGLSTLVDTDDTLSGITLVVEDGAQSDQPGAGRKKERNTEKEGKRW